MPPATVVNVVPSMSDETRRRPIACAAGIDLGGSAGDGGGIEAAVDAPPAGEGSLGLTVGAGAGAVACIGGADSGLGVGAADRSGP
jgi:hypothetical protein